MFVCLRVYGVLRVQYELVRYELSPLHSSKVVTPLSPHRSSLRNKIVNQSELYLYSPLKKAVDVYANQNGDRPPHSQQTNSLKNILLLQYSVHRVPVVSYKISAQKLKYLIYMSFTKSEFRGILRSFHTQFLVLL